MIETGKLLANSVKQNLMFANLVSGSEYNYIGKINKEKEVMILLVLEDIQKNIENGFDISLEDISIKMNISYSYLSKTFKEVTGESFITYLNKYRLDIACKLLNNTDDKISKIANDSGFCTARNLNRAFKNYLGKTPTEYRNS